MWGFTIAIRFQELQLQDYLNTNSAFRCNCINGEYKWNESLIRQHFIPEDANHILRILLPKSLMLDCQLWAFDKHGNCGYQIALWLKFPDWPSFSKKISIRMACNLETRPLRKSQNLHVKSSSELTSNGKKIFGIKGFCSNHSAKDVESKGKMLLMLF